MEETDYWVLQIRLCLLRALAFKASRKSQNKYSNKHVARRTRSRNQAVYSRASLHHFDAQSRDAVPIVPLDDLEVPKCADASNCPLIARSLAQQDAFVGRPRPPDLVHGRLRRLRSCLDEMRGSSPIISNLQLNFLGWEFWIIFSNTTNMVKKMILVR